MFDDTNIVIINELSNALVFFISSICHLRNLSYYQNQFKMREKQTYISPESQALEMKLEGVIAASGDPQNYNDPFGGSEY